MKNMKIGRPTDSAKDIVIKARVDSETDDKLSFCVENTGYTKSEIIRIGIDKIYNEIKRGKKV